MVGPADLREITITITIDFINPNGKLISKKILVGKQIRRCVYLPLFSRAALTISFILPSVCKLRHLVVKAILGKRLRD